MKVKGLMVPVVSAVATVVMFGSAIYFLIHSATSTDGTGTQPVASGSATTVPAVKATVSDKGSSASSVTTSKTTTTVPSATRSTRAS